MELNKEDILLVIDLAKFNEKVTVDEIVEHWKFILNNDGIKITYHPGIENKVHIQDKLQDNDNR